MDFIRTPYTATMRAGSGLTVPVRWFRAHPGAKVFPRPHHFASTIWDRLDEEDPLQPWENTGLGEQTDSVILSSLGGANIHALFGKNYCGTVAHFQYGQSPAEAPLAASGDGVPQCCPRALVGGEFGGIVRALQTITAFRKPAARTARIRQHHTVEGGIVHPRWLPTTVRQLNSVESEISHANTVNVGCCSVPVSTVWTLRYFSPITGNPQGSMLLTYNPSLTFWVGSGFIEAIEGQEDPFLVTVQVSCNDSPQEWRYRQDWSEGFESWKLLESVTCGPPFKAGTNDWLVNVFPFGHIFSRIQAGNLLLTWTDNVNGGSFGLLGSDSFVADLNGGSFSDSTVTSLGSNLDGGSY